MNGDMDGDYNSSSGEPDEDVDGEEGMSSGDESDEDSKSSHGSACSMQGLSLLQVPASAADDALQDVARRLNAGTVHGYMSSAL